MMFQLDDSLDHVRFSGVIERPAQVRTCSEKGKRVFTQLTRINSNCSMSENDSENGSTAEADKTPESAETTWMRDKKAK